MKCLHCDYKTFKKFKEKKELDILAAEDTGYKEFQEYKDEYGNHSTIHFKKYKKYEEIKAFKDNNSFLCFFVLPMFSVSIVVISVVALCTQKNTGNLVKVFTYFLALITLMATIINYSTQKKLQQEISNKKLIAEIIAKSRIEWLKEMREHVSIYMSLANQASFYLESHWESLASDNKSSEHFAVYNSIVKEAETYYYKIMFNLNSKEQIHSKIESYSNIFKIDLIRKQIKSTKKQVKKFNKEKEYLVTIKPNFIESTATADWIVKRIETIAAVQIKLAHTKTIAAYRKKIQSEVGSSIQAYFKREWDKAKEEIKSGEVATPDIQEK